MIQLARLYDGVDSSGNPFFSPTRDRIEDPEERARVARFLDSGKVIRRTTGRDVDRIDPSCGRVVPMSSHTDGTWIWNSALRYYVTTHGVAPEPEFLAHIARRNYEATIPEEPTWREALQVLRAKQQPTA
ncbi:MAG: hypothetical protein ACRDRS_06730 [Pseudonocardiaceae bacterium]